MSWRELAAIPPKHRTFHNDASYQVQQYESANDDNYANRFYKSSYDVDSSSVLILDLHCPFPSLETYLHCNDPNDHSFCKVQSCLKPAYKHDHSQGAPLNRQYIVRSFGELSHPLATKPADLDRLFD